MMKRLLFFLVALVMIGCEKSSQSIVSNVNEREANIIIVFLESKGIPAYKEQIATGPGAGATSSGT